MTVTPSSSVRRISFASKSCCSLTLPCTHVPSSSPNIKEDGDRVDIYTASAIQNHADIRLTRGGIFLIGLLSGGDYDVGVEYHLLPTEPH
jgi:hypothetical protein